MILVYNQMPSSSTYQLVGKLPESALNIRAVGPCIGWVVCWLRRPWTLRSLVQYLLPRIFSKTCLVSQQSEKDWFIKYNLMMGSISVSLWTKKPISNQSLSLGIALIEIRLDLNINWIIATLSSPDDLNSSIVSVDKRQVTQLRVNSGFCRVVECPLLFSC